MGRVLEAIYEDGVLKPLEAPGLDERQRVKLELLDTSFDSVDQHLAAWHQLYEGFSDKEVEEIETIVLDRSNFMKRAVDV